MGKGKKDGYSFLGNLLYVSKNLWRWERFIFLCILLQTATGAILPLLGTALPKVVLDQVSHFKGTTHLILILCGFTIVMAILHYLNRLAVSMVNQNAIANRMHYLFLSNRKTMECDYEAIESGQGQLMRQKLNNAVLNDIGGPQQIVRSLPLLLTDLLGLLLYGVLLASLHPAILVLLALASVSSFFLLRSITHYIERYRDERNKIAGQFAYLAFKAADFPGGKDVRMYKMKDWFQSIFTALLHKDRKRLVKEERREYLASLSDAAVLLFRDSLAYAFLIYLFWKNRIGVSDFVLYFGAITGFSVFFSDVANQLNTLLRASFDISVVREFLERPDASNRGKGAPLPKEGELPVSITFDHVYFRYAEHGDYILNDLCLSIKKGEKVALVGANGAGKTTLVKLLCGFYTPLKGQILINGISTREYNVEELYTLFSAVFQDILLLPFSVLQNVAMGSGEEPDRERARECLDKAGLASRLPDLDAPVTKLMAEDGIELSGGEQQKLLLARALYKAAPILVLDEPTAALDPIAENLLYQSYESFSSGKTSLYISHRLASTSFCDRVAFLEDGRITEIGTHGELLKQNRSYAQMFRLQSHYYKEGGDEEYAQHTKASPNG